MATGEVSDLTFEGHNRRVSNYDCSALKSSAGRPVLESRAVRSPRLYTRYANTRRSCCTDDPSGSLAIVSPSRHAAESHSRVLFAVHSPSPLRGDFANKSSREFLSFIKSVHLMSYIDPLLPLALAFVNVSVFFALRSSNKRHWMLVFSVAGLLIISSSPLSVLFAKPLKTRYDCHPFVDNGEAIVVLAGACRPAGLYSPYTTLAANSYSRSLSAVWLYHSKPPRPVLVTGLNCAPAMARLLESEGVAQNLILQEGRATNTHENAVYSANLLRANRIGTVVLVTDAKSMLRAELCFRKEGVTVIPYPVGLGSFKFNLVDLVPSWQAIKANSDTVHEFLGLLRYRWAGWV